MVLLREVGQVSQGPPSLILHWVYLPGMQNDIFLREKFETAFGASLINHGGGSEQHTL